jgi:hypothetical protein
MLVLRPQLFDCLRYLVDLGVGPLNIFSLEVSLNSEKVDIALNNRCH